MQFLDASKWQGPIDPALIATDPRAFRGVILRATDTVGAPDPMLPGNLAAVRGSGRLWAGAYHNLRAAASVTSQFAHFRGLVADWAGLVPMVDAEQGTFSQLQQFMALAFLEWGVLPLVYLPRWAWLAMPDRQPLPTAWTWVHSRYNPDPGPLIPPHTTLTGLVWQHSQTGRVPGINAAVDLNRYYGDEATFLQLAVQ